MLFRFYGSGINIYRFITNKKACVVLGWFSLWGCQFLISAKLSSLKLKNSTSLYSGLRQFQFLNAHLRQALFTKPTQYRSKINPKPHRGIYLRLGYRSENLFLPHLDPIFKKTKRLSIKLKWWNVESLRMFSLNSGNCLSVLGTVGAADIMNYFVVFKYSLILMNP